MCGKCETKDVARMLGVSSYTVKQLISDGELKAIAVRNLYRIPEDSVRDYLNIHSTIDVDDVIRKER